jgi:hypothetical protein
LTQRDALPGPSQHERTTDVLLSRDEERVLQKAEAEQGVTEIGKMAGRGHSPTIDAGWREVVEKALDSHERFLVRPASDHGGRG